MTSAAGPAAAARALARRLAAFEEGELRAGAAARALGATAPAAAAELLGALAAARGPEARAALIAIGQALAGREAEPAYAWRAEVYAVAAERGLAEVTGLLLQPPARAAWRPARDPADPRLAHLTLGHKKAMARGRGDPDLLARLAAEGAPAVVRELLRNPRLTEGFVVRIAARRPCNPATLRCLLESPRWRTRPAVVRAVARNPHAEPAAAVKLLPLLGGADLADLAGDAALHPVLRALAARLAAGRRGAGRADDHGT